MNLFILIFPQYLCNLESPRATGDRPRRDSLEVSKSSARPGARGFWVPGCCGRGGMKLAGVPTFASGNFLKYYRYLRFPFGTLQRLFRGSVCMMERVGVPTSEREEGKQVL